MGFSYCLYSLNGHNLPIFVLDYGRKEQGLEDITEQILPLLMTV